ERHPTTAWAYAVLGGSRLRAGRPDLAEPLLRRAADLRREVLGQTHSQTVTSLYTLALCLHRRGRDGEALDLARRAGAGHLAERRGVSFSGRERALVRGSDPLEFQAVLEARAGRPAEAWDTLERGLARALLDDLAGRERLLSPSARAAQHRLQAR